MMLHLWALFKETLDSKLGRISISSENIENFLADCWQKARRWTVHQGSARVALALLGTRAECAVRHGDADEPP